MDEAERAEADDAIGLAADWRPILGAAVLALLVAGGLLSVFGGSRRTPARSSWPA